jgi:hypothetical protein
MRTSNIVGRDATMTEEEQLPFGDVEMLAV